MPHLSLVLGVGLTLGRGGPVVVQRRILLVCYARAGAESQRTLARVLGPSEAETMLGTLNTATNKAIALAMLLAGLRPARYSDAVEGGVFIRQGKGGHQRPVPSSARSCTAVS